MISNELQKKIDRAIRLIKAAAPKDGSPIEVAYSGGKDSDVILQLTREAGVKYRAIYKCTTIDPKGTIAHAKAMGAEVLMPEQTFLQIIAKRGLPNRMRRFCCGILKEYKVLDKAIIGVRKAESARRAKRYKEPTQCRVYRGGVKSEQIFPILDWSDTDVADFINDRQITCAPVYYDGDGVFHVERRLGCIGCPLAYKTHRIEDFKKYPKLMRAIVNACGEFMRTHPDGKAAREYADKYEYFTRNLFYDTQESWKQAVGGMFEKPNCKEFLENYFDVKLD